MRIVERISHLFRDPESELHGERPFVSHTLAQRSPLHQRHHIVQEAVGVTGVVQREDVRVIELRGEPDLAKKAGAPERLSELRL